MPSERTITGPMDHLRDLHATGDAGHARCARCHNEKAYDEASYHERLKMRGHLPDDQLPVAPERSDGGPYDDYEESHPAYAMIGASRVQGRARLAGSEFQHQNFMVVTIKRAVLRRGLSHDHWLANQEFIEVKLSEAQWATFLSATNVGDGVPCTVVWEHTMGHIPGIATITDRRQQTHDELADRLKSAVASLDEILDDPKSTKVQKARATSAKQQIESNLDFVLRSFDEHMEKTVEKAKIEVDAFITGAITRAGITALGGTPPPIMLGDGTEG